MKVRACDGCGRVLGPLEAFPGGVCLGCAEAEASAEAYRPEVIAGVLALAGAR